MNTNSVFLHHLEHNEKVEILVARVVFLATKSSHESLPTSPSGLSKALQSETLPSSS